jgi:predicted transcriptional regulator
MGMSDIRFIHFFLHQKANITQAELAQRAGASLSMIAQLAGSEYGSIYHRRAIDED